MLGLCYIGEGANDEAKAALNKFTATLLEHELKVCMHSSMEGTSDERLDKITKVLTTLLKQS